MCLYPRLIRNKKYTKTQKNGGIIPPFSDERVLSVPVKCGKCMECKKQKSREWTVRLMEDLKSVKHAKFITLTFSNESIAKLNKDIPLNRINKKGKPEEIDGYLRDNLIATRAVRLFLERWRKEYKTSLRHWLVTELGHKGTENIHLHGFVWTDKSFSNIREKWDYGFIWPRKDDERYNMVNEITVNYVVKYVSKMDLDHPNYEPIILNSPGIGRCYTEGKGQWLFNKYNHYGETEDSYRTKTGHKISLPIYWRNKIYSEEERENLWLQKLDKQERWVNGERIDVSNGVEEYYKVLRWHQERNERLGYGSDTKNWKQAEYEKQRRKYLLDKRIKNATPSAGSIQKGTD